MWLGLNSLLALLFSSVHDATVDNLPASISSPPPLTFELRHEHAVHGATNRVIFADVPPHLASSFSFNPSSNSRVRTRSMKVYRPKSQQEFQNARLRSAKFGQSAKLDWDEEEIPAPDVKDRETLIVLAKMTNNAYLNPGDAEWYDLGDGWSPDHPFGWEPDEDGFRGHVFATPDNSTIVLSIKGTSAGLFGGGGPTAKKDKLNDNLLFSCCCARVDISWTTVCGCYSGGWKCDQDCLESSLVEDSLFYPIGTNLYNNLTYLYPNSNIWLTGHSLGGSLAALLAITFGVPSVSFESPGERMASRRLHLPHPPDPEYITHVYHNGDPIPQGACTGILSSCFIGGYALESRCHLGRSIIYDTTGKKGWSVDVRTHRIGVLIEQVLNEDWDDGEGGPPVPRAEPEGDDCLECYSWEYGSFQNSSLSRNAI